MYIKKEAYLNSDYFFFNKTSKDKFSFNEIELLLKKVIETYMPDIITSILDNQKIDPELDLLSRHEVAEILKVSLPTLHNYKHSGKLIPTKKNGRVYYKKEDIKKYLKGKEAQNDR